MIINAIDLFNSVRQAVELDRQLARDYGIVFIDLPDGDADIIIDGRMIAFIPEED